MLLQIPGVLNQGEIERLRSELAQASFEDGACADELGEKVSSFKHGTSSAGVRFAETSDSSLRCWLYS